VQVSLAPNGGYLIDHVVEGDTVTEVLNYVSYNKDDLVARLRKSTETSLRAGKLTLDESRQLLRLYEEGLSGYTYLEKEVGRLLRGEQRAAAAPGAAGWGGPQARHPPTGTNGA
jgi:arginine decarboxylase